MKKLWCLVVLLTLFVATEALAARVYLKDGSVVECQSFWRSKGTVYVKVNRDVLLEFAPDEVNVKKTFAKRPVKKKAKAVAVTEKGDATDVSTEGQSGKQPSPGVKPAAQTGPQAKPAPADAAAAKGAPVPAAQPKPASPPAAGTATAPGSSQAKPVPVDAAAAKGSPATSGQPKPSTPPAAVTAAAPATGSSTSPAATSVPATKPADTPGQLAQAKPSSASAGAGQVSTRPVPRQITPPPASTAANPSALGAGLSLTFLLVPLLLILIILVAMWRVFEKAGEAGWKAIVPIYNLFVLVEIAGKPWWWSLLILFVPLIGLIFYLLACLGLAQKFSKSPLYGVLLCFFGFIMFPLLAFDDSTYSA